MSAAAAMHIVASGMVTSLGHCSAHTCAAIRAGISNASQTLYKDDAHEWITGHSVQFEHPLPFAGRLASMAADAIAECLAEIPPAEWNHIPLLLCLSERPRPGRAASLADDVFTAIETGLRVTFPASSAVIEAGKPGVGRALQQARTLLEQAGARRVIIAAADSLLHGPVLRAYLKDFRLLTSKNSHGLQPGEAGSAVLVTRDGLAGISIEGVATSLEPAPLLSDAPLRGEGLAHAAIAALEAAGRSVSDMSLRLCDVSGEAYFFREAALVAARLSARGTVPAELWHPADCIGDVGSATGPLMLGLALTAARKGYLPGERVLATFSGDGPHRAAAVIAAPPRSFDGQ